MSETIISVDEFQALEQKVLRAVEIIRHEREARANAEAEVSTLRELLNEAEAKQQTLNSERENVRQRVEKMLSQMDELL